MTSQEATGVAAEETKEYKDLIRQRGSIKGRLTNFVNFLSLIKQKEIDKITDSQMRELTLRVEKLEALFTDYETCQLQIEVLCSVLDEQIKERLVTEGIFYTSLSDAQTLISSHPSNKPNKIQHAVSNASIGNAELNVKLPVISLPKFEGNYFSWLEYRDTYESLIHYNDMIPDINKFHYLRSSLEGSAALVIKSIEFTSQNYKVAWDLLCQRYNNKRVLINNHLKALFKIDPINKESHRSIRYLIDVVTKNLRALATLGQPVDSWDTLIIYMVSTKLDPLTSLKWEEHRNLSSDLPLLSEFVDFLRNRADILETTQVNRCEKTEPKQNKLEPKTNWHYNKNDQKNYNSNNNNNKFSKSFITSGSKPTKSVSCPLCSKPHRIVDCDLFKNLSIDGRIDEVQKLNLCINCLRRGHEASSCRLGSCRLCPERHNTMLHKNNTPNLNLPVTMSVRAPGQVLLGTALVKITNPENNITHHARAVLDAGSQSSFMTENLKQKLDIVNRNPDSIIISGINNVQVPISDRCIVVINSLTNTFTSNLNCLIVPHITGQLPNMSIDVSQLKLPPNLKYADPYFYNSSDVDLLLGADIFFNILCPDKMSLGDYMPILQNTKLGWIVAGPLTIPNDKPPEVLHCHFTKEISENLTKFWNLEEVSTRNSKLNISLNDEFCEEHFLKHMTRDVNGRFSVSMPLKENPKTSLGNSYKMAIKRFYNIENRLNKTPKLKKQYQDFIHEYEALGHLKKINKPEFGYYLPHHPVIRDKSETTALRVVFDASAKTDSKKSLNDIQYIGPIVQDELFNILLRFRQHKYIITADIQKMYRQVLINENQRNLQLILWRDDNTKPLQVLQLQTVTYGTASAPFLSTRCLLQLALECPDQQISEIIKNDIYMDDLLTGADSETNLIHIRKGITEVLNSGCFPLHKFRTNCSKILKESSSTDSLDLNKQSSVLGVIWTPKSDTFHFSLNLDKSADKVTKRTILSNTCKIFDPLGLLSASTVSLKILLQKLWQLKLSWDEPVPNDIMKLWQKMTLNLETLLSLSVPRYVMCSSCAVRELHCFVDASQQAYAACVYMRTINDSREITVRLVCAKTRVAPLKIITIPRLELCAALLGARLVANVSNAFRCTIHEKVFWSDSTITLGWIKTQPKTLNTFVCNRINEIHDLTARNSWRHIPTKLNPADMGSRGVEPSVLLDSSLWWEGPSFLTRDRSLWPQNPTTETNLPEIKSLSTKTIPEIEENNKLFNFENYSSSSKLKRIFAYVNRFINNCKKSLNKFTGALTKEELEKSFTYLIKCSQTESFYDEIALINKQRTLTSSSLLQLSPFLDDDGVLRVGGRLNNTAFNFEKKHPILLDSKHHFTKLLMQAEHLRQLHAGPQLLLSSFRDQFWPLGGRTLARKVARQCVRCARFRGKTIEPLMGQLPANRVTQNYPFQVCGTDLAGPLLISSRLGRGNRISKCYLCLFVCFCTKAIHIEIVSDLSSNAFLSCLRRFISRRGKPNQIFCDNATNFVGANNELNRVMKVCVKSIHDFTAEEGIQFNFNPPYSPTFGGLWEAGVKSAKFHLKRVAGGTSLTYEELSTLCTQIEAILNSRPLTPLSADPHDLSPLTPGHFLIGRPLTSLPTPPTIAERYKTRYQMIDSLRQGFWKRWHKEYLSELQIKTKWRTSCPNLRQGDLVIFKDDNLPPMRWKLGRVIRLYPGRDEVCRVADFKTIRGIERRALNKVCPLWNEGAENSPMAAAASPVSSGPPGCLRQQQERGPRGG